MQITLNEQAAIWIMLRFKPVELRETFRKTVIKNLPNGNWQLCNQRAPIGLLLDIVEQIEFPTWYTFLKNKQIFPDYCKIYRKNNKLYVTRTDGSARIVQLDTEKWQGWRENISFMFTLAVMFKTRSFTLKEAYEIYLKEHAVQLGLSQKTAADQWIGMNVRNTLSAAAHRERIQHIGKGLYQYTFNQYETIIESRIKHY